MSKSQQSWVRSQDPPTQRNQRGGRWSSVEKSIEEKKSPLLIFFIKKKFKMMTQEVWIVTIFHNIRRKKQNMVMELSSSRSVNERKWVQGITCRGLWERKPWDQEGREGRGVGSTYGGRSIGEPGEQCTVVFALIVTGPASECVCRGVGSPPPPPQL